MNFKDLCEARFSVRSYSNAPVAQADIDYIMACVRLAPSACNRQPWQFLLIGSPAARERLQQCYNRPWFATAPLYVLCLKDVEHNWVRPADGKAHGDIDVAIAAEHLCLAAAERGLGTCWVCNFDPAAVAGAFPMPGFEPVAIIALGHPAADCPRHAKERRPVAELLQER